MAIQYHPPKLIEYGRIDQVTLGATGPNVDFLFQNGQLTVDSDPNCTSNTGFCVVFASI